MIYCELSSRNVGSGCHLLYSVAVRKGWMDGALLLSIDKCHLGSDGFELVKRLPDLFTKDKISLRIAQHV
jgi:hypothetical protein